jgi:arylsulfatase
MLFTANDCLDLGSDLGSPVGMHYYDLAPFAFTGTLHTTTVEYTK